MSKRILIIGANGQLGTEIAHYSKQTDHDFIYTDVDQLDVTNASAINAFLNQSPIDLIINCSAYNAVDRAEDEEESAFKVNATAPLNLAKTGIPLIHVSTDFVFDGKKSTPYVEEDIPNPLSVYAKSKLQGELNVMKFANSALVIRTSWLYSMHGSNFVKTIQSLAQNRKELTVIFDQIGSPTYAGDLAQVILKFTNQEFNSQTLYHYSNEGVCSWYDFAIAICKLSDINCTIRPIEAKDFPAKALRPHFSLMNKKKIKQHLNIDIPHWQTSLARCISSMKG